MTDWGLLSKLFFSFFLKILGCRTQKCRNANADLSDLIYVINTSLMNKNNKYYTYEFLLAVVL